MTLPRSAELQWQQEIIELWLETPGIPTDSRTSLLELLKTLKEEKEKLHVQPVPQDFFPSGSNSSHSIKESNGSEKIRDVQGVQKDPPDKDRTGFGGGLRDTALSCDLLP